jgi:hypothetical protein
MPFISENQIATLQNEISRRDDTIGRLRRENKENTIVGSMVVMAEVVGGAGIVGFMRGKFEKSDGSWGVPGVESVDAELAIGAALLIPAFLPKYFGKYGDDFANVGAGVLAHYAGQVGRKFAKTGKLDLVAGGGDVGMVPEYVGHVGALPEYVGDARAEELAAALARAAA